MELDEILGKKKKGKKNAPPVAPTKVVANNNFIPAILPGAINTGIPDASIKY